MVSEVRLPIQTDTDAKQDQEIRKLGRLSLRRETIALLVASFSVVVSIASAVISLLQWNVMNQQLQDARRAIKETVRAASVEYGTFLRLNGFEITPPRWRQTNKFPSEQLDFRFTIINASRTPALDVYVDHVRLKTFWSATVDQRSFEDRKVIAPYETRVLTTDGTVPIIFLTEKHWPTGDARSMGPINMQCDLHYKDVFGASHTIKLSATGGYYINKEAIVVTNFDTLTSNEQEPSTSELKR